LYNQYTVEDIVLRALAAVVVPWWVAGLSSRGSGGRTDDLPRLLLFLGSAVALGALCLVVYDTALLYNLGHLDALAPVALGATIVLAATRVLARRVPGRPPGRNVEWITRSAGWLLVLAAVPALPIRYGLG